jgi:outer membrane protein assembly factor BamB
MNRLAALACVAAIPASAQQMFRGNSAHTGIYAGSGPRQLGVKWIFKAGGPIVASAAIADGLIYIGSMDGNLYALQ